MAGGAATGMASNLGTNPYAQAAMAQQGALGLTQGAGATAAGANPWMFAYNPTSYQATAAGSASYNPAQMGQGFTYDPRQIGNTSTYTAAQVADPAKIAAGMGAYTNPWEDTVIGRTTADMNRNLALQQEQTKANAIASGAFGGGRHGLVEGQNQAETNRAIGDMAATQRAEGFRTAADLSGRDLANLIGVQQGNQAATNAARQFRSTALNTTSQLNQAAANAAKQYNAGNRQQAAMANLDARSAAKQFGANAAQQSMMANAAASNAAKQFKATAANSAGQTNAAQAQQLFDTMLGRQLGAGAQMGQLGQQSMGYGDAINGALMDQGTLAQNLLQQQFGQAAGMFDRFTGQPTNALNLRLGSLGVSPLNNAGTQTTRTSGTGGGAMDILGAGLGMIPLLK